MRYDQISYGIGIGKKTFEQVVEDAKDFAYAGHGDDAWMTTNLVNICKHIRNEWGVRKTTNTITMHASGNPNLIEIICTVALLHNRLYR